MHPCIRVPQRAAPRLAAAMFFHLTLKAIVRMHPSDLGPTLMNKIRDKLQHQEEGKCTPEFGFVVAVIEAKVVGKVRSGADRARLGCACAGRR